MAYEISYKKRYSKKLVKILNYLEKEWSLNVADDFVIRLKRRLNPLSKQPYIGVPSIVVKNVRSILITRHNRLYYKIDDKKIIVLNIYDTRINPKKNILRQNHKKNLRISAKVFSFICTLANQDIITFISPLQTQRQ